MATNWITIQVTDLNDYLVAAQVSALRTAALAGGQTDPFNRIMPDVVARIRLKIESCQRNQISLTANTVPPEVKWIACMLIIEAMQTRLPGLGLTDEQKDLLKSAKDELDLIGQCKSVVTKPTDPLIPADAQRGGPVEVASSTTRVATRDTMNGL